MTSTSPVLSVADGFLRTVSRYGDRPALRTRDGRSWTWAEHAEAVARAAGGLRALGVGPGDRVVLLLRNRPEFHVVDTAAMMLGATPISLYNSSSVEQLVYLIGHCRASVAVTETGEFASRVLAAAADVPTLQTVVVVGPDAEVPDGCRPWSQLAAGAPLDLDALAAAVDPTTLLTVIYTSGTTGPPKGVMIDHTNVVAAVSGYKLTGGFDEPRRVVSYLPMAHIAERMVTHYDHLLSGHEVVPCPDLAELGAYLVAVRPHVLFGPPRVWEKLVAGIRASVAARGEEASARFAEALAVGRQVQRLRSQGLEPDGELAETWAFVDEVAFAPVRRAVGLDECLIAFSGAAPIPVEVVDFLRDIGLPMSEVYGMSENTGGMTWEPQRVKVGSAGRAYPNTEVVLAEDGEVLCRGPIVFKGYLDDPERTAEALDADGWLHTGDIGEMDDDGYLRIVDRKKEILITAGGKNVSPANIEAALKTIPLVGQAVVIGDGRPYLVALVTLDPDLVRARYGDRPLADVVRDPDLIAEVVAGVADVDTRLSAVESVRRLTVLAEDWLPDSDVLTPTMKLKRRGVAARYGDVIDAMYAGGGLEVKPAAHARAVPGP